MPHFQHGLFSRGLQAFWGDGHAVGAVVPAQVHLQGSALPSPSCIPLQALPLAKRRGLTPALSVTGYKVWLSCLHSGHLGRATPASQLLLESADASAKTASSQLNCSLCYSDQIDVHLKKGLGATEVPNAPGLCTRRAGHLGALPRKEGKQDATPSLMAACRTCTWSHGSQLWLLIRIPWGGSTHLTSQPSTSKSESQSAAGVRTLLKPPSPPPR